MTASPVPEPYGGLWDRINSAVGAVTGAGTLWNGRVVYSDPADPERGSVGLDGTVRLSAEHVVRPLETLFRKPGLTQQDLEEARGALKATVHEWMHLAFRPGVTLADRERDLAQEDFFPIEEGVTEAFAHRCVNQVAAAVLPPHLAERINSVRDVRSYPAYAPAAARFAGSVAAETGVREDQVLRAMVVEPRTRKARAAAELLYANSELPGLVRSPDDRLLCVGRLSREINRGFAGLRDMQNNWPADRVGASGLRGLQIADAATQVLRDLEEQRRTAANEPEHARQAVWAVDRAGTIFPVAAEPDRRLLAQTMDELLAARPVGDVGDGLWRRVHAAVTGESGAGKSLWNGQLSATDLPISGLAGADGSLTLNDDLVVRPLQQMYERRGQVASPAEWAERRRAFKSVAHEFSHLTAPAAHQLADRQAGLDRREFRPIEEGVTEAWSVSRLDRLADRVLPADLAEGIKSVSCAESYPAWAPAARSFVDKVGAQVRLSGDEVLQQMNKEAQTGKAGAAAGLLFERSALPRLVPAAEHAAVRERIRVTVDEGFAALAPLKNDASIDRAAVSRQRGVAIAAAAISAVRQAERQYGGAVGPAVTAVPGRPARAAVEGNAELASLRAVLDHQAPAAAAPQLRPGQAAAERGRSGLVDAGRHQAARGPDR